MTNFSFREKGLWESEIEDCDPNIFNCCQGKNPEKSLAFKGKSCLRKPYKGYAYGGLVEEKCHNFWCEKKHNYAQQIEFNENNVILYPNNEDPGKILAEKKIASNFAYIQIRVFKF